MWRWIKGEKNVRIQTHTLISKIVLTNDVKRITDNRATSSMDNNYDDDGKRDIKIVEASASSVKDITMTK